VLACLDIKGDNNADLAFRRIFDYWRPGGLLSKYVVNPFLIREEDIAVKAFFACGEVIGAETLLTQTPPSIFYFEKALKIHN